jgi:hypothetical protein
MSSWYQQQLHCSLRLVHTGLLLGQQLQMHMQSIQLVQLLSDSSAEHVHITTWRPARWGARGQAWGRQPAGLVPDAAQAETS